MKIEDIIKQLKDGGIDVSESRWFRPGNPIMIKLNGKYTLCDRIDIPGTLGIPHMVQFFYHDWIFYQSDPKFITSLKVIDG